MDRRTFLATVGALALAPAARAATPEDAKLRGVFDRIFEDNLARSPEALTRLGLDKGERAAAKSKLDSASIQSLDEDKALTLKHLADLKTVDRGRLSPGEQPNYDAVLFTLEGEAAAGKRYAYGYQGAGQPYVLSQLTGAYQDIPDFLGSQHGIETKADADAYLDRLVAFGVVMDEETARVRRDRSLGVVPPAFVLERTLAQMTALRASAPAASPLTTQLTDRVQAKGIEGNYAAAAERAVAAYVYPALDRQIALVRELQPEAKHDAGVWRLPDGETYYRDALRNFTTTNLSPKEIHQMGLEQAKALGARADAILKGQGLTRGTVGERIAALFADPKHHYANTDQAKEELIADLNKLVAEIRPRLPEMFGALPKADVEIRRVPKFIEAGAPGGYYNRPALDGSRPGIYWINLRDSAENPRWTLKTLTYHEAIPGHHMQRSLQQEADLPMLRRTAGFPAFAEGWALYSEQVALEMGMYRDDPLGELGQIQASLFRAARLVVDTGLHAMKWSREKAIQTMVSIDGSPVSSATTEIERYCVRPGQACAYMVGKLTWLRLRAKAQAALGPSFDIRQFHDAGLLGGAMPLTVLEGVIDRWVATQKA
ncbi:DUF885 domain-containing protein [Phenylobacterium kunshanense]|uniref:DUF885 domain-containing protein n=1 Tax=Phenylobacterium kunshanense TaxID=1445034 RepID=A0A328BAI9_9CAUL|nr:DUF885 family protein [Phenylobacterium kunshanense]RAK63715.1 DUF885 domain-containing protein [Phenylobacterium kunshanense]